MLDEIECTGALQEAQCSSSDPNNAWQKVHRALTDPESGILRGFNVGTGRADGKQAERRKTWIIKDFLPAARAVWQDFQNKKEIDRLPPAQVSNLQRAMSFLSDWEQFCAARQQGAAAARQNRDDYTAATDAVEQQRGLQPHGNQMGLSNPASGALFRIPGQAHSSGGNTLTELGRSRPYGFGGGSVPNVSGRNPITNILTENLDIEGPFNASDAAAMASVATGRSSVSRGLAGIQQQQEGGGSSTSRRSSTGSTGSSSVATGGSTAASHPRRPSTSTASTHSTGSTAARGGGASTAARGGGSRSTSPLSQADGRRSPPSYMRQQDQINQINDLHNGTTQRLGNVVELATAMLMNQLQQSQNPVSNLIGNQQQQQQQALNLIGAPQQQQASNIIGNQQQQQQQQPSSTGASGVAKKRKQVEVDQLGNSIEQLKKKKAEMKADYDAESDEETKQNIKKRIEKTKTAIGKKEDRQIQLLEELDDDSDGNLSGEEDVSTS